MSVMPLPSTMHPRLSWRGRSACAGQRGSTAAVKGQGQRVWGAARDGCPRLSYSELSCTVEMAVVPVAEATPNQMKIGSISARTLSATAAVQAFFLAPPDTGCFLNASEDVRGVRTARGHRRGVVGGRGRALQGRRARCRAWAARSTQRRGVQAGAECLAGPAFPEAALVRQHVPPAHVRGALCGARADGARGRLPGGIAHDTSAHGCVCVCVHARACVRGNSFNVIARTRMIRPDSICVMLGAVVSSRGRRHAACDGDLEFHHGKLLKFCATTGEIAC